MGECLGKILRWYIKSLKLGLDDFLFCKLGSKGEVLKKNCMNYGEARKSVEKEQKKLGIKGLTLHSARVGGATEAAACGVGRAVGTPPSHVRVEYGNSPRGLREGHCFGVLARRGNSLRFGLGRMCHFAHAPPRRPPRGGMPAPTPRQCWPVRLQNHSGTIFA